MSAAEIFLSRSRYWLTKEYPIKLRHCVNALPRGVVWARPNHASNSVGNLLVHLTGNVTEWILGGVGGREITRDRAREFARRDGDEGSALLENLEANILQQGARMPGSLPPNGEVTRSDRSSPRPRPCAIERVQKSVEDRKDGEARR